MYYFDKITGMLFAILIMLTGNLVQAQETDEERVLLVINTCASFYDSMSTYVYGGNGLDGEEDQQFVTSSMELRYRLLWTAIALSYERFGSGKSLEYVRNSNDLTRKFFLEFFVTLLNGSQEGFFNTIRKTEEVCQKFTNLLTGLR